MPGFLKRYPDAKTARGALRSSRVLRAMSVPTPEARPGPSARELLFDRIDGRTGHALIGPEIDRLLPPLAALHSASVPDLLPYDPMLRTRHRLCLTDARLLRDIAHAPVPKGAATLHGDLHVGQFIAEPAGKVWIVDLDDLALGPPEADLANFAVHLATTDQAAGIAGWAGRVCRIWTGQGGTIDQAVFTRFLQFALLRRHLKLREAGRPDHEREILAYLRDSASFSIR